MLDNLQIKNIIKLSKLKIPDDQISKFGTQINEILNFVEMLKEVDISNSEFLSFPVINKMRNDTVKDSLEPNLALANCQNIIKNGFGVPSVLGKST